MITHTFFDKCNTILENSEYNTGLNPVAELNAGNVLSRILIHFDIDKIRQMVKNGEINVSDLTHKIKMTNCGNINLPLVKDKIISGCSEKERAVSFDIIAFKLPYSFDEGKGFDYYGDYAKETHKKVSKDGSNWFNSKNGAEWDEYGVYFNETLLDDYYEKFNTTEDSIIIGEQHFDNGTENLEIDVTNYINNLITNDKPFYGIGLSFHPKYENETLENRFISFFTNHTNTFFLPYLETINNNNIFDNRTNFYIGRNNKLYFFVSDNGEYVNLDNLPKCNINGTFYDVKQNGKGIYYIDIKLTSDNVEPYSILYDTWSDIVFNGEHIDDVELEFVVLPMDKKVSFGKISIETKCEPQLSGINEYEKMKIGEIREVLVDFIEEYSYCKKTMPDEVEYRVYVKENDREIDVFDYQPIERRYDQHMFVINTNDFIPNDYHIDIRIKQGRNIKYFNNVLNFTVVSNITNYYI